MQNSAGQTRNGYRMAIGIAARSCYTYTVSLSHETGQERRMER